MKKEIEKNKYIRQFFDVLEKRDSVFLSQNKNISIGNGKTVNPKSIIPMAEAAFSEARQQERKHIIGIIKNKQAIIKHYTIKDSVALRQILQELKSNH